MMIAIIMVSLSFSTSKLTGVKCDEVKVIIPEDSPRFMDEEEITSILTKLNIMGHPIDSINTEELENKLRTVTAIKNVEVFRHINSDTLNFKGSLIVDVEQRDPVFRVISGNSDYYMDEDGVLISGTQKYAAHVLLATGNIQKDFARESLLPFVQYISTDEFWKAQIKQIYVENDGELILVPLIGDQRIEFGKAENIKAKLRNLKALYDQEFPQVGWDYYKTISLKYNNQVVCTKR